MKGEYHEYPVLEHHDGQRLDNFLMREHRKVPKSLLYRLMRTGRIRVNGHKAKPELRLEIGDKISMPVVIEPEKQAMTSVSEGLSQHLKQAVLFESSEYLILNKPAGLAVHGGTDQSQGLIESVRLIFEKSQHWELAHRIDKETSGCIVIAKKRQALLHFQDCLKTPEGVRKTYHLLVMGRWPKAVHKVELPLYKSESLHGHVVRVDKIKGKYACTTFEILKSFPQTTLLSAHLKTGRTHQIRVHSAAIGCPIVGDPRYSQIKPLPTQFNREIPRMFLHAQHLKFHTSSGELISVEAPFDEIWIRGLHALSQ